MKSLISLWFLAAEAIPLEIFSRGLSSSESYETTTRRHGKHTGEGDKLTNASISIQILGMKFCSASDSSADSGALCDLIVPIATGVTDYLGTDYMLYQFTVENFYPQLQPLYWLRFGIEIA